MSGYTTEQEHATSDRRFILLCQVLLIGGFMLAAVGSVLAVVLLQLIGAAMFTVGVVVLFVGVLNPR